ncbi:hypothetical protein GUITHDRAFT_133743 [Guillardia theta CCMP2712]|uniref:Uncharacterized protein n=1 Tax=Guillardia theta (strain CCMP2712) TaxID=905079 RepID=L1JWI3_GUITC|nr:hypothetical protein GUITHDRAFT_133743 [Guillardia theta CCMP2712]EKX52722.1 hypothetical protein GUITHDRAFT_133743 [Guillardia theta CCMP2712]|eukprot:XP_005839702.1 hypothetical protein GUITHDRAFT_133743 [Guillardia theta CCMP2712]
MELKNMIFEKEEGDYELIYRIFDGDEVVAMKFTVGRDGQSFLGEYSQGVDEMYGSEVFQSTDNLTWGGWSYPLRKCLLWLNTSNAFYSLRGDDTRVEDIFVGFSENV